MRLSRWGKASYETEISILAQKKALSAYVDCVADNNDAEIVVIHSKLRIGLAELQDMPSAKLIVTTTSGYEHMDIPALHAAGIRTLRMPLLRRDAVVDTALGLMLTGMRRFHTFKSAAVNNQWVRSALPDIAPLSFRGLKVGIVGCGVIGRQMVAVLKRLGAVVYACDPNGVPEGAISVDGIMALAHSVHVLSLHCDLNPSSANIVSPEVLQSLPKGAILVNTARGGLVDEAAALTALKEGQLSYLGLDVFASEPCSTLHSVNAHRNIDLLPHAAGFHQGLLEDMSTQLSAICRAFVAGDDLPFEILPSA